VNESERENERLVQKEKKKKQHSQAEIDNIRIQDNNQECGVYILHNGHCSTRISIPKLQIVFFFFLSVPIMSKSESDDDEQFGHEIDGYLMLVVVVVVVVEKYDRLEQMNRKRERERENEEIYDLVYEMMKTDQWRTMNIAIKTEKASSMRQVEI